MAAFREPMRCIHDAEDLDKFKEGETLAEIMLFVKKCAEKSIGMKVSEVSVEPGACVGVDKFVAFVESDATFALVKRIRPKMGSRRPVPTWRIATFWRYALKGLGPCPMDPLPYDGV